VRLIGIFAAVLWSLAAPRTATAQSFGVAKFLAGGAVALGMHEAGHVVLDLAAGASPGLEGVRFGTLPFFAITHEPVSPVREFAISSAGFCVQHASSEIILTRRPRLRDEQAPVLKGMLAFNVLASVAYAGAVFGGVGPEERDTRGMALAADVAEPIVGVMLLMPAALDAMRYYRPEARWVRWVSRAAKAGGVVLIARSL
jgi:hypothetical protein